MTTLGNHYWISKVRYLLSTGNEKALVLIRLLVGIVFLSEGLQKFLFPATIGAGRFAKIGIPAPEFMGYFVGGVEVCCGTLVLLGLFTRVAVAPLISTMVVAILSTKIPILLGHGFLMFADPAPGKAGFWSMLHESRTDLSMLLSSVFLLIVGAGPWSLDARLVREIAPHDDADPKK